MSDIRWEWRTIEFHAGWSSRVLVREPYKDGDRPILGVASAACSWKATKEHEEFIARACSAHGELVRQLKDALLMLRWKDPEIVKTAGYQIAEGVLAKAEGRDES